MIGYYVHHQGVGHLHRATAVADYMGARITLLGSGPAVPGVPWLRLSRDDVPAPGAQDVTAAGALHWAPVGHAGARDRAAEIAAWVTRVRPGLVAVDVSVEVLLLLRLLSVPTVAVAMRGDRTDRAHRLGYDTASRIVAPWPAATQHQWPADWLAKTVHVGAVSRFDGRAAVEGACPRPGRCVLLLLGSGGHGMTPADVAEAAAVGGTHWHVLGTVPGLDPDAHPGVDVPGWVTDPWELLCRSDVVVAAAGTNAVADTAAARRPLVAVPQPRPFAEQDRHAGVLAAHDLAEVAAPWPDRRTWPALLERAQARGGAVWADYLDGRGAARMAAVLCETAAATGTPRG